MRTTDEIVADVCSELSVERVEIRPAPVEPAQQIVRTASFAYYGNDRLDVSYGSSDPIGGWFAPSRQTAKTIEFTQRVENTVLVFQAWEDARTSYIAEMRASFGVVPGSENWEAMSGVERCDIHAALARGIEPNPAAWDALLALQQVTLVCGCAETARCHRVLLAGILVKFGATYAGEVR